MTRSGDVAAAMVSQRTSEAVLGIPKRAFLESLHRYRASGGVVSSLGKLRLVDAAAYRTWIEAGSAQQESDPVKRAVAAARARRDALG